MNPGLHFDSRRLFLIGMAGLVVLAIVLFSTFVYKRSRTQFSIGSTSSTAPTPTIGEKAKQVEDKILRKETLSGTDIAGLSAYELRVLRNLHFARYGRKYDQDGQLGSYFYTRPWYNPSDSYSDGMITAADKANINLILAAEKTVNESNTLASNGSTGPTPDPTATPQQTNAWDSPVTPADTLVAFYKSIDTGDFEWYIKRLYSIDQSKLRRNPLRSGQLNVEQEKQTVRNQLNQLHQVLKGKGGLRSIDVQNESMRGDNASVSFVIRFNDGSTNQDTLSFVRIDGVWIPGEERDVRR